MESLGSSGTWEFLGSTGVNRFTRAVLWWYFGSSGVVKFTNVQSSGRWIHQRSLCSLTPALVSLGLSVVIGFTQSCPGSHWVHVALLDALACALVVVGFVMGRCVS